MPGKPWPAEVRRAALEAARAGAPHDAIAARYGMARQTVANWVNAAEPQPTPGDSLTTYQVIEIAWISKYTLDNWVRMGVLNPTRRGRGHGLAWTRAEAFRARTIAELVRSGVHVRTAAERSAAA